ncbi:hypothetical protein ACQP1O_01425 [Nocardia sp. CA-151230]|uniref:hypothetical protein n=1 Tax=Nocardia sp. CA-151230 TaxID=3239982 RepID=UPI003D8E669B
MTDDPVITNLLTVLDSHPELLPVRISVIELPAARGRHAEALTHCATALAQDPRNEQVTALLQRSTAALAGAAIVAEPDESGTPTSVSGPSANGVAASATDYDWDAAEAQVGDLIQPAFVNERPEPYAEGDVGLFERPKLTLADVGGMDHVKQQLELSLLGPVRNPELATRLAGRAG